MCCHSLALGELTTSGENPGSLYLVCLGPASCTFLPLLVFLCVLLLLMNRSHEYKRVSLLGVLSSTH